MNWTGGSLQRTKHANKGVVQKQKAYFAKARTQLQNGTKQPIIPFRPSFLCEPDTSVLASQMPSFGSGSVRHTGHSARLWCERIRRETSPGDVNPVTAHDGRPALGLNQPRGSLRSNPGATTSGQTYREQRHDKRKTSTADPESQMLETNKKRLLREQDWIGIDASKPVNLRYVSSKEKNKIGKRRKKQGCLGATARQRNITDFLGRPQVACDVFPESTISGATRNDTGNIRIRIGTDALTTVHFQTNEHVRSRASSGPMLFDESHRDADCVRKLAVAYPVDPHLQSVTTAPWQADRVRQEHTPTVGGLQRRHSSVEPQRQELSCDVSERSSSDDNLFELQDRDTNAIDTGNSEEVQYAPGYRMTHRVEGNEQSLRLVFENSSSSAGAHNRVTSRNRTVGQTRLAQETASAGATRNGHLRSVYNGYERPVVDETTAALAIVDEEPWKTFLAISNESSSHSYQADEPGNGGLHCYPNARNNEAVAIWSQHATQGDQTHISSSIVSAPLPSIKRGEEPVSARPSANIKRRGGAEGLNSPRADEDERLWKAFVFGSDNKSSSEQIMSRDSIDASSKYLPLSAAVSSVSVTPFRSVLEFAPSVSDNAQDTASFAPLPVTGRFNSPAFHEYVEGWSHGGQGNERAGRSEIGEQSVTHASLQNNTSCDTDLMPSKFVGDMNASDNSLGQLGHASNASHLHGTTRRSVLGRRV